MGVGKSASVFDAGVGNAGPPPQEFGGGSNSPGGSGPDYGERLRRARLGLAIALTPVLMLFLSFTAAYAIRQHWLLPEPGMMSLGSEFPSYLPWTLFAFNTFVLLASSFAIERARRSITRQAALAPVKSIPGVSLGNERTLPWLEIATALGFLFLFCQWMAWRELQLRGFFLATTAGATFVYIITGMHAVHLLGGLGGMLYAIIGSLRKRVLDAQRIVIDVTAWFWHFLGLLWIYILVLLLIAR